MVISWLSNYLLDYTLIIKYIFSYILNFLTLHDDTNKTWFEFEGALSFVIDIQKWLTDYFE